MSLQTSGYERSQHYQNEFEERAKAFWPVREGSGPAWELGRKKYLLTASSMAGLWNGVGFERTGQLLGRLVFGEERVFNEYQRLMLAEGKKHEDRVIKELMGCFFTYACWRLSPGIFEFDVILRYDDGEKERLWIGASPDGMLFLERHQIPIEVKWHAHGVCQYPMPCKYFIQLYTQMLATRALYGLYYAQAPDGKELCAVITRSRKTDLAVAERVAWFHAEYNDWKRRAKKGKRGKRYTEAVDALDAERVRCTIGSWSHTNAVLDFLRLRIKHDDENGTTDLFDLERNAIAPTRPGTPTPCALPLPRSRSSSPRVGNPRSRSPSPNKRPVPEGELGACVVEGDEEVEGAKLPAL